MNEIFRWNATEADLARVIKKFEKKLKEAINRIDFATEALAFYYYVTDKSVPLIEKSPAIFGLLYFINPFDLIPDIIPFTGYLDDAGVVATLTSYYSKKIEPYRERAKMVLDDSYIDVNYKIIQ
jgi:uncharacterized membrane protein YkvA (DUF1232 family)